MVLPKPGRAFILLSLLTATAACQAKACLFGRGDKGSENLVRALVVEVSKSEARVISSKLVRGRLPQQSLAPVAAMTAASMSPQDLHIEFELQSSGKPFYGDHIVVALRPIVEGQINAQLAEVEKRAILVAVPDKPADKIVFYRLDPKQVGPGGEAMRIKIGESRIEGMR